MSKSNKIVKKIYFVIRRVSKLSKSLLNFKKIAKSVTAYKRLKFWFKKYKFKNLKVVKNTIKF